MDSMSKMWASLIAIGLMVLASLIISFARAKTRGIVKFVLTIAAFVCLFYAIILGLISIL